MDADERSFISKLEKSGGDVEGEGGQGTEVNIKCSLIDKKEN